MSELEKIKREILQHCGRDFEGDRNYRIHYETVAKLILAERRKNAAKH